MPYSNREKQNEYQRQWIAKRREKWFSDKECKWCGSTENLVLHHLDPNKKESHRIWSWSWERILEEVKKCIVVCDSWHKRYHGIENKLDNYHGTKTGYYKHKCKCEDCRNYMRQKDRKYRAGLVKSE